MVGESAKGLGRKKDPGLASGPWRAFGAALLGCPGSPRAPPPGLSHGTARVPTRGCCGERGQDAAGPRGKASGSRPPSGARTESQARVRLAGGGCSGAPRRAAAAGPAREPRARRTCPPWRLSGRSSRNSSCSFTPRRGARRAGGRSGAWIPRPGYRPER